jgi:hypothetical protein
MRSNDESPIQSAAVTVHASGMQPGSLRLPSSPGPQPHPPTPSRGAGQNVLPFAASTDHLPLHFGGRLIRWRVGAANGGQQRYGDFKRIQRLPMCSMFWCFCWLIVWPGKVDTEEVTGSNPVSPTREIAGHRLVTENAVTSLLVCVPYVGSKWGAHDRLSLMCLVWPRRHRGARPCAVAGWWHVMRVSGAGTAAERCPDGRRPRAGGDGHAAVGGCFVDADAAGWLVVQRCSRASMMRWIMAGVTWL